MSPSQRCWPTRPSTPIGSCKTLMSAAQLRLFHPNRTGKGYETTILTCTSGVTRLKTASQGSGNSEEWQRDTTKPIPATQPTGTSAQCSTLPGDCQQTLVACFLLTEGNRRSLYSGNPGHIKHACPFMCEIEVIRPDRAMRPLPRRSSRRHSFHRAAGTAHRPTPAQQFR